MACLEMPVAVSGHLQQAWLNRHSWLAAQGHCEASLKEGKIGTRRYPFYADVLLQSAPGPLLQPFWWQETQTERWPPAIRMAFSEVETLWVQGVRTLRSVPSCGGLVLANKGSPFRSNGDLNPNFLSVSGFQYGLLVLKCVLLAIFLYRFVAPG